jgi:hydroxymethylpyrimidine/phosphomethylpyrimidine kinase
MPEAEALTGRTDPQKGAELLLSLGCHSVLIKGGHADGEPTDFFYDQTGSPLVLTGRRIHTMHTHGTGCTLSAAITALLAAQVPLRQAVTQAKAYVQAAIESAPGFGNGHGPLNHFAPTGLQSRSGFGG